jgi:UDP-glucose 4-epimerase
MNMTKKRVLITGATGFLGRQIVPLFRDYDCVFLLSLGSTGNDYLEGICYDSVDDLVLAISFVDVVIHLAAFIPYGSMDEPSAQLQEVNVELTQQLAKAYAGARWVFASSVSVYGSSNEGVVTTSTLAIPNNPYGQSKLQAEQIVSQLHNAAIVRFSSIIGKGMKSVSMIPKWIEQARAEGRIQIWGKGTRTQNYIDVRDAAMLVHLLAFSNWKGIVLGISPKEYSNAQVAATIASQLPVEIEHTAHADESGAFYEDSDAQQAIGFIPKFDLRESIIDIIEG